MWGSHAPTLLLPSYKPMREASSDFDQITPLQAHLATLRHPTTNVLTKSYWSLENFEQFLDFYVLMKFEFPRFFILFNPLIFYLRYTKRTRLKNRFKLLKNQVFWETFNFIHSIITTLKLEGSTHSVITYLSDVFWFVRRRMSCLIFSNSLISTSSKGILAYYHIFNLRLHDSIVFPTLYRLRIFFE